VVVVAFRIEKEEYVNRTFRLSQKLIDKMYAVCGEKNISLNKLVVMCVNYALDDLEVENPSAGE
jgi:hypothetical protein